MAYISFQPKDYFNTKLYTGNATDDTAITGVGFQPDWLWGKNRTDATNHYLIDAVRGITKNIKSQSSSAEATDTAVLKSFDSDGFTLGDGSLNQSSHTFVTWNWKANGQGSANSDGSINTTYTSVNTTSGFSICQWEGTGANATIGHGLGAVPKMYIVKNVDVTNDWNVYHHSIGNTHRLFLNTTQAKEDNASAWNDTSPTSSVFSVGTNTNVNQSGSTMIAYVFAEKQGFSKFGSYTGNGNADGAFIYTGFKVGWVMIKNSSATESWYILDNKRPGYNTNNYYLLPNTSGSEGTSTSLATSLLSNGFKINNSDTSMNTSGQTYIYMAFAEAPLVSSNGVPAVAR